MLLFEQTGRMLWLQLAPGPHADFFRPHFPTGRLRGLRRGQVARLGAVRFQFVSFPFVGVRGHQFPPALAKRPVAFVLPV